MLLFYRCLPDADLDALALHGLHDPDGVALHLRLTDAARAGRPEATQDVPVLVVDTAALDVPPHEATEAQVKVRSVPPGAIQNLGPYRPPTLLEAGGGYVVRALGDAAGDAAGDAPDGADDLALLLIHRKGRWDIPKGKRDAEDATIEACALREVREEVGIDRLRTLAPAGTTHHGYVDGDAYAVKATTWYLMQTPERSFTPEVREGIRRVAWARWTTARRHVGYATLRRHMDRIETLARRAAAEETPA
jgi:8-oxo-dGTP pyrophosphatase MutT (NUDIX family)